MEWAVASDEMMLQQQFQGHGASGGRAGLQWQWPVVAGHCTIPLGGGGVSRPVRPPVPTSGVMLRARPRPRWAPGSPSPEASRGQQFAFGGFLRAWPNARHRARPGAGTPSLHPGNACWGVLPATIQGMRRMRTPSACTEYVPAI